MADYFLGNTVKFLVGLGLYDVVLPFVFVFTITYAILEKIKIFGDYRNIHALIALCFSFAVTASIQFVDGILTFFSVTGLLMVGGVSLLIIIGLFGLQGLPTKGNKWYNKVPHFVVIGGIGLVFAYLTLVALGADKFVLNLVPKFPKIIGELLIAAIVFLVIIKFIVGPNKTTISPTTDKAEKKKDKIVETPDYKPAEMPFVDDREKIIEKAFNKDSSDYKIKR